VLDSSGIELVVLRPPIVYGEGDRDVLTVIQQIARGWIPVVGGDKTLTKRYSLVHVDDVAAAIAAASVKPGIGGKSYFTPGPRDATFLEMLTAIEEAVGRRAVRIPVPHFAAAAGAAAAQAAGALLRRATVVNLDKLREAAAPGWQCSGAAAVRELGYRPRIDFPEGIVRQVQFARAAGDLRLL
jgi:nucleoside-diphosphate-sugar epimerase